MKTLAVVIGNNDYHSSAKLDLAVKDAQDIAAVFSRLGYEVIHKSNITAAQCSEVLVELESKIEQFDATIFFFAGHGFELDGENYLTSIDCQIPPANRYACGRSSIMLSELLGIYKKHPNKINIAIIDACRKAFERGAFNALAPVQAPQGTLIAFSTSPEKGSQDSGFENNSIYTGALLKYIGREMLSVEDLFKKVRKTVYTLTGGKQTPWEHTSLIGDFYFNSGQLVHSLQLPYSAEVVKDVNFQGKADEFTALINETRTRNWDRQNPAFDKLLSYRGSQLDKNQQFILGRNLLQAGEIAFSATNFFGDLKDRLTKYMDNGENHVLNGILFEIYFDSRGEFRKDSFKAHCFDRIMALRKLPAFSKSFDFIRQLLQPYKEVRLFWLPSADDTAIDVDVQVTLQTENNGWGGQQQYDVVNTVKVMSGDITDQLRRYELSGLNGLALKKAIGDYLAAPESLIEIHSNKEIEYIAFLQKPADPIQISWA